MREAPSLLCCVLTAGMWEFLHGLGLWSDVGLSGPDGDEEASLVAGAWRFGASGGKGAWADATPGLVGEGTWPCCCPPKLCLGGKSEEECWDDRPVGLLGGTDRSECW